MIHVSIGNLSRSPLSPLSLRMMSRADLIRLPRDWAVVGALLILDMRWSSRRSFGAENHKRGEIGSARLGDHHAVGREVFNDVPQSVNPNPGPHKFIKFFGVEDIVDDKFPRPFARVELSPDRLLARQLEFLFDPFLYALRELFLGPCLGAVCSPAELF